MSGCRTGPPLLVLPLCLSLLCTLSGGVARGQGPEPERPNPLQEIWRTTYYEELLGRSIHDISEGREGRLWFATSAGVASYDGLSWSYWSINDGLLEETINAVLELSDGSVMAGGRTALSHYEDGEWSAVLGGNDGLHCIVTSLYEARDGSVWAASELGALHIEGERKTLYCIESVRRVLESFQLDLEFQVLPPGVAPRIPWQLDLGLKLTGMGESWMIMAVAEGSEAENAGLAPGDRVLTMHELKPRSGPQEREMQLSCSKPDGRLLEVRLRRERRGGEREIFGVASVVEDSAGRIVLGLRRGGLVRIDSLDADGEARWASLLPGERGGTPVHVTPGLGGSTWAVSDGMKFALHTSGVVREDVPLPAGTRVDRLACDPEGLLWVLSRGRIYTRSAGAWQELAPPQGHETIRMLLLQRDGVLWLADRKGFLTRTEIGTERLVSYAGLRYACQAPGGSTWFITRGGNLLERGAAGWRRHEVARLLENGPAGDEGLGMGAIDAIRRKGGDVLAYSTSGGPVSLVRWDGSEWRREALPYVSIGGKRSGLLVEDAHGTLWLGPGLDELGRSSVLMGVDGGWRVLTSPVIEGGGRSIVAAPDNSIWLGTTRGLYRARGEEVESIDLPWRPAAGGVTALSADADGNVWVGSSSHGLYRKGPEGWTRFYSRDKPRNHVLDLSHTLDGVLWGATHAGLCRLDHFGWQRVVPWHSTEGVRLRAAPDGRLWVHENWNAVGLRLESTPPETWFTSPDQQLAYPGPVTLSWSGSDPWSTGGPVDMTWSYRVDGGKWSAFRDETSDEFPGLSVDEHRVEVRSRDASFNVDPTPAVITLEIIAPVWRRPWFILLVLASLGVLGLQARRMARRDRRLHETNARAEAAEAAKEQVEAEVAARLEAEEAHRALETELIQSRKLEAIGQLAGGIAHDFNNILTAIWGNTSELSHILETGPYRDPQALVALNGIHAAADRAAALTRQLLMVGRRQVVKPEALDPNEVIAQMSTMLKRVLEENVHLEFVPDERVGAVLVDRSMFEQVVLNLVVNARDAMPSGGRVLVRTENITLGERQVAPYSDCEPGAYVKLSVCDEGEGMTPETMERAFDPFFTTKPTGKGTGLGLSTVFAIARQSLGFVTVASEPGKGSRFEVSLPSSSERPPELTVAGHQTGAQENGAATVLVCEDDHTVRDFVDRALERHGYEVLTAGSGEDALELTASYDGPVELLLTDVIMPGIDGRELARRVRLKWPEIEVLYMSGHAADVLADRSELAKGIELLQKPFTTKTLLDRVRGLLGPNGAPPPAQL